MDSWIKCSVDMPENGLPCIVCYNEKVSSIYPHEYDNELKRWRIIDGLSVPSLTGTITHWMYYPSRPGFNNTYR